jgi:hypothetical protein
MHIASIGIDLGKNTFHLVALGDRNKVLLGKKFSRAQLLAYTANLPILFDRSGGMCGSAWFGIRAARARAPGATDPGAVCKALSEIQQERLPRYRSHRRGGDQIERTTLHCVITLLLNEKQHPVCRRMSYARQVLQSVVCARVRATFRMASYSVSKMIS